MVDFGALPPEINSIRMYAGPGSGPILAAAAAWDGLAAELDTTSTGYTSVITELAGSPWRGPASQSMAAAAAPYISWLSSAAALAEEAGNQARVAAAAYETAFALTVPPPVVLANRALLSALVATNFFGQNTPAIAGTEAQYAEMWAQDAVAMYGYAGSSAVATQLIPFSEPAKTTDQGGLAAQSSAVSQAVATPAANAAPALSSATPGLAVTPESFATSIFTWINQQVQQLLTRLATVGLNPNDWYITTQFGQLTTAMRTSMARTYETSYFDLGFAANPLSIMQQLATGPGGATAGAGGAWFPTPQFAGLHLGGLGSSLGAHTTGGVSANLASSTKIGGLSVPSNWASSPSAIEESATQAMAADYATANPQGGDNGLLRGMPMGGGSGRRGSGGLPPREYGFRRKVLIRPPSAG
ncbi:MAG: PPE family protein [Mycobacterium sp.]